MEEILENEFNNLAPTEAQQLYLTVCVLGRLGVPVRAGLISRIHGKPFSGFKERLFKPLEHVVYDSYDAKIRDHVYTARHTIIADIVFERILRDQSQRYEVYIRCLSALNVDYSTDSKAFKEMIRGRVLLKLFSNPEYCYEVFARASQLVGAEPHLLQQQAIYEMNRPGGSLNKAGALLAHAIELQPYNKSFKHTKSELSLKKVDTARTPLEREKFLREAATLATETRDGRGGDAHGHHTLVKVHLRRLQDAFEAGNTDFSSPALQGLVRPIEAAISEGLQAKPGDAYLLSEQARFATLINDDKLVVTSLEEAVARNSKLGFLAIRLSECYRQRHNLEEARKVLERAIDANRNDKDLNYRYALLLIDTKATLSQIIYFLRRAFSPGDRNFDAQLRYCRFLFLNGDYDEARKEFYALRNAKGLPRIPDQQLYPIESPFIGTVASLRHSHVMVKENQSQYLIYIRRQDVVTEAWNQIAEGARVQFTIAFNLRGPIGRECRLEGII